MIKSDKTSRNGQFWTELPTLNLTVPHRLEGILPKTGPTLRLVTTFNTEERTPLCASFLPVLPKEQEERRAVCASFSTSRTGREESSLRLILPISPKEWEQSAHHSPKSPKEWEQSAHHSLLNLRKERYTQGVQGVYPRGIPRVCRVYILGVYLRVYIAHHGRYTSGCV